MNKKIFSSVFFKIFLLFTTFLSLSLLFLTSVNIKREVKLSKNLFKDEGFIILQVLEKSLQDPLYFEDIKKCSDIMESLGKNSNILISGKLYASSGQLIADAFDDSLSFNIYPVQHGIEITQLDEVRYIWEKEQLLIGKPIIIGRTLLGAIEIGLPINQLNKNIYNIWKDSISISAIIFVLFLSVIIFGTSRARRSITTLTLGLEKLSDMDYNIEIEDQHNDELGRLVQTYNKMRIKLQDTYTKLEVSEERYSQAVKGANDGIWDWDLKTGFLFFSSRWLDIVGYRADEVKNDYNFWLALVYSSDRQNFINHIDNFKNTEDVQFEIVYRICHKDGSIRWVQTRGVSTKNRLAGSQTDITVQKEVENELKRSAFYDCLTGLPNRILLIDRINHVIDSYKRDDTLRFAVMFLDFDGFKHINDTYGHGIGDLLLSVISKRLKIVLRPNDTVARVGGDEFVILLDEIESLDIATEIASRILTETSKEYILDGHSIFISVSIGIAENDNPNNTAEDLIQNSDAAMYQAKLNGKGQYSLFHSRMLENIQERWSLEHELHKALYRGELYVYYQPLIDVNTGRVVSFESLMRWHHPVKGLIMPKSFIPAAEETGFITEITKWVLHKSCIQAVKLNFNRNDDIVVFVNVTAKDFLIPGGLTKIVKDVLDITGCQGNWLGLEVTESILIQNYEVVSDQLSTIKDLGLHIELDDFGTGYSSLSYLYKFPLTGLKIDRSFIKSMVNDETSKRIVKTIINMASDLSIDVVAEGVDDIKQLNILMELNCYKIQGFYFSEAIIQDELEGFVNNFESGKDPLKLTSTSFVDSRKYDSWE